jgi:subtilisin-like proprotein convertase family protein
MKKIYFFLLLSILGISSIVKAQVSNYGFSQSVGTYTPITGGTTLGTTTSDDQSFVTPLTPAGGTTTTGIGFPIGFNFTYNGTIFDRVGIQNNGWIALGQSALTPSVNLASTSNYTPLSSASVTTPAYLRSRIAGIGRDLQAQAGSTLMIETIGTAPNRVFVAQWTNYRKYSATGDNINFQIRLNETSNTIDVVYGTVVFNTTANTADVGLGGITAADFNNRTTTTDWNASTAGTSNTDRMTMNATVIAPVSGRTFTWTPPPPCSGTPAPGTTQSTANPVCSGVNFTLSVQNNPAVSGLTYQWQSSTDGTTWTNIAGATSAAYTTAQTAVTYYQLLVTCSGVTTASTPLQVTMNAPLNCYCTPPATSCTASDVITNVTVATLNNNSTCSTNGYANYTATVAAPDLIRSASQSMSVAVGPGGTEYVGVWIDYNVNGIFEASEFTALGTGNGTTVNGTLTVPASAPLGVTRMRVRVRFGTALTGANACLGYTYGETEDYKVNIVPCIQGVINTQPANVTTSCGSNATFNVAATGSALTYVWQYRTSATAPWQLVPNAAPYSGVNSATLVIANAPASLSGYQYRVIFSGACTSADYSNSATLTVTALVATVSPASATICLGSIQQLSITNTTPVSIVRASSAPALNITIPDDASTTGVNNTLALSGIPAGVNINSIKVTMNVTHSWVGDMIIVLKAPNGKVLNLAYALTGTGGTLASTGFTNTVISSTGVTALSSGTNPYTATFKADAFTPATGDPTVPTGPDGYLPNVTTFAGLYSTPVSANGNWTLAMYDYYDDLLTTNKFNNWSIEVTYSGGFANGVWTSPAPNSLYTDAAATLPYDGVTPVNTVYAKPDTSGTINYKVVVNNGLCTTAPLTVPVTVNKPVSNLVSPVNRAVCNHGNTTFTVSANGGAFTYQWQVSTNGGTTYTNVADGSVYSGATTNTLTVSGAQVSMNGYMYKAIVSVAACSSTAPSNPATLTVNPTPVVTLTASPYTSLTPGLTTTLSAAVSPNAGATYTWFRNGVMVPGATAATLVVDIDGLGEYTVSASDVNTCTAVSNAIVISDSASSIVFVYPSPNTGQFQVRYQSAQGNNTLPRTLNVYDSKGARVYSASYTLNAPYEKMSVDMRNQGKGVYMVELADRFGKRLKTARVIIL